MTDQMWDGVFSGEASKPYWDAIAELRKSGKGQADFFYRAGQLAQELEIEVEKQKVAIKRHIGKADRLRGELESALQEGSELKREVADLQTVNGRMVDEKQREADRGDELARETETLQKKLELATAESNRLSEELARKEEVSAGASVASMLDRVVEDFKSEREHRGKEDDGLITLPESVLQKGIDELRKKGQGEQADCGCRTLVVVSDGPVKDRTVIDLCGRHLAPRVAAVLYDKERGGPDLLGVQVARGKVISELAFEILKWYFDRPVSGPSVRDQEAATETARREREELIGKCEAFAADLKVGVTGMEDRVREMETGLRQMSDRLRGTVSGEERSKRYADGLQVKIQGLRDQIEKSEWTWVCPVCQTGYHWDMVKEKVRGLLGVVGCPREEGCPGELMPEKQWWEKRTKDEVDRLTAVIHALIYDSSQMWEQKIPVNWESTRDNLKLNIAMALVGTRVFAFPKVMGEAKELWEESLKQAAGVQFQLEQGR